MRAIPVLATAAVLAALCVPAFSQDGDDDDQGTCMYNGRSYASSVAVCQAGQVQICVGGEWQSHGQFCQLPDGATVGVPILGPGQVILNPGPPPVPDQDDD
ncbi:MAG: hypothetical protein AB1689_21815 [Thermodesulfobacteriota bacterium]